MPVTVPVKPRIAGSYKASVRMTRTSLYDMRQRAFFQSAARIRRGTGREVEIGAGGTAIPSPELQANDCVPIRVFFLCA